MSGVFISYRRDDSAGFAGRLFDALRAAFPGNTVFIDIDGIDAGRDFVEALNERLASCEVLLAVIGRQWLEAAPDGRRRIDRSDDYVRLEIETALTRNIRVIPILVGGAQMPAKEALPASLEPLVRRNAMELSHARFAADVQRLVEILRPLLPASRRRPGASAPGRRLNRAFVSGGVVVAVLPIVLLLAVWAVRPRTTVPGKTAEAPVTRRADLAGETQAAPAPRSAPAPSDGGPPGPGGERTDAPAMPSPSPTATRRDERGAPATRDAGPSSPAPEAAPKRAEAPVPPLLRVLRRFDPDTGKARIEIATETGKTVKRHAWCERLTLYTEFGNFSLVDWHKDAPAPGQACRVRTDWKNHRTDAILASNASPWPRALNDSLQALCPKTFLEKLQGCEAY